MSKMSKLTLSLLAIVVIALAFGVGYTYGRFHLSSLGEGLDTVAQAWNIITTDYVDKSRIDTDNMTRSAIEGMLETLDDPYSSYLEAEQYELGLSSLEGEFSGIGTYITVENGQLKVIAPIAGSPAEAAGIKAGDTILEVDGEPVAEMSAVEAIIKIRGPSGTAVQLLILHEGETEPQLIKIVRTRVEVPSVRFEMMEETAYINVTEFTERTGQELAPVLQGLSGENATGIVLDLRGNPGGLLDTVISVASYFLPADSVIVQIRDNRGNVTPLKGNNTDIKTDLPMVVLVDEASASGSEVLSGALQDHKRALIAGTTTYGKGSVNILRRLDDGSGIYITTGRWLTPDGHLIEGEGIKPDRVLELTGEDAVQWAIDYLKGEQE